MENSKENKFKGIIDSILIYNLYILIFGSVVLAISYVLSINGNASLYNIFQKL